MNQKLIEETEAERILRLISGLEISEHGIYTNAGAVMRQMARNYFIFQRSDAPEAAPAGHCVAPPCKCDASNRSVCAYWHEATPKVDSRSLNENYYWLIERGQSVGHSPTIWWKGKYGSRWLGDGAYDQSPNYENAWTTNANDATKFFSKDDGLAAGKFIFKADEYLGSYVVCEHGFIDLPKPLTRFDICPLCELPIGSLPVKIKEQTTPVQAHSKTQAKRLMEQDVIITDGGNGSAGTAPKAAELVACPHEWYLGKCVHCEMTASEYRAGVAGLPPADGMVSVPVEPTEEMIRAALDCQDHDPADPPESETYHLYKAMIAAAGK